MLVATRQNPLGLGRCGGALSCFGKPREMDSARTMSERLHLGVWVRDLGVETFATIANEDIT